MAATRSYCETANPPHRLAPHSAGREMFSGPSLQAAFVRLTGHRLAARDCQGNRRPCASKCHAAFRASRAAPPAHYKLRSVSKVLRALKSAGRCEESQLDLCQPNFQRGAPDVTGCNHFRFNHGIHGMDTNQYLAQSTQRLWSLSKKKTSRTSRTSRELKRFAPYSTCFYMFYTAKSNPLFRVFSVFRGLIENGCTQ